MATVPERYKEKSQPDKLAKEKTLGSGSGFMSNMGRKQLLQSIRRKKDLVTRNRRDVPFQYAK